MGHIIEDETAKRPLETVIEADLRRHIDAALDGLSEVEQIVIRKRFGLNGQRRHTLEEVGRSVHLTRERIRQIETKALRKLRLPSQHRKLKTYISGGG